MAFDCFYHIISYQIISFHNNFISYHIKSFLSYDIMSCCITSHYIILYDDTVSHNVIPLYSRNHQQSRCCHPALLISAMTFMSQDGLTGSAWGDWANYTASPLRAFENELGVQAPVGFWDPAGFTADGSVENFKRRRATEIKHGRISMLATMGYITPVT